MPQKQPPESTAVCWPLFAARESSTAGSGVAATFALAALHVSRAATLVRIIMAARAAKARIIVRFGLKVGLRAGLTLRFKFKGRNLIVSPRFFRGTQRRALRCLRETQR